MQTTARFFPSFLNLFPSVIPSFTYSVHKYVLIIYYVVPDIVFNLIAYSCPTLCDPMDCSMPGLPVNHQLPELTQTYVHSISDAIQSSHPLSLPSSPAFNLSQHQGLFK